ncbi:anti-sigma factor [Maritimibacter sp. UBA3975]|uniref:anti-sigma factor n=1 Tax=Maritimibacter sp. UBA3975 TaxID=1946833 RepID=UPI0025C1DE6C|nr:anti-sigma factor [Maritimibacter sp. UBA3975]|tara:strand:- start:10392 stop:11072 length:681 start_codon:yes stop_codon:yes gene_type:complete
MSETELPDDDRAQAGEYVLGLMSMEDAAAFRARISREPGLAALVLAWQEDFAQLTDEVEAVPPPSRVWRHLERDLFGGATGPRWLLAGIPGLLAGALAVMLLFVPLPGDLVRPPADPVYHIDLASAEGTLIFAAGYDGETNELFVRPETDAPEEGTVRELWIIAGDNQPVSMGLLPDDEPARLAVDPDIARQLAGATLAISVEPPGGSPTGAPTGPVIATGPVETL